MQLTDKQKSELSSLNHRPFNKGELVLLAKVLSDKLPLYPDSDRAYKAHILTHKSKILTMLDNFYSYTCFSENDLDYLFMVILQFTAWRNAVANGGYYMMFSGDHNTLIDDLTGMPKFVDCAVISELNDVLAKANPWAMLMKELVDLWYPVG